MYATAEVRWFYRGPIPAQVGTWFERGAGSVEREPPRTDRYLWLPDSDRLNIKLREGRIEIKRRVGEAKETAFCEQMTGMVEEWRKWSFELVRRDAPRSPATSPSSDWIAVRKERRLRTYQVKDGQTVVSQARREPPAQGCELELTQVHISDQTWWTLAFEAFGDESTLRDTLLLVAGHVLSAGEPTPLSARDSHGYAAWLSNTISREAPR